MFVCSFRCAAVLCFFFFFSSRRRHTRFDCDWSSDVCSSDLLLERGEVHGLERGGRWGRGREGLGGQGHGRTRGHEQADHGDDCPPGHCAPPPVAGFTMITTAFAGSRYFAATRRTSCAVTARTRSKSLLISASDGWNMS